LRRELILITAPAICGVLLLATSQLDLYLFEQGVITAREAVGYELVFFVAGFVAIFVQLLFGIRWLWGKRWKPLVQSILSTITFLILFVIAGVNGAAILNAT